MLTVRRALATMLAVGGLVGGLVRTEAVHADEPHVTTQVCLASRTAADLDTLFYSEPGGVIGADYQRAFTMPDGRVLWTFQDAAVRLGPDAITIVHNIVAVQDGNCFTIMYRGTRAAPEPFLFADRTAHYERWFWPMDATVTADGRIAVFTAEFEEHGPAYLTRTVPVATWVAIVDPAAMQVVEERPAADASADLYGWSVTSDDTWTYLYAQCYRQFGFDEYATVRAFDRSCATDVTVARIPRGQVFVPPEYWDGASWQADPNRATPIIDRRDRRINANQFEWTGAGFVSVNYEGDWWGDTIYLSASQHPAGPFVVYDTIRAPLKCHPAVCNSFFATWVPAMAVDRPLGRFVISVAHNRWDGVVSAVYRPSFVAVQAPAHVPAGGTVERQVDGDGGAVVLNVGVVGPAEPGFLSVYPCDRGLPNASNVNHVNEPVVSNIVLARPDAAGRICVYSRSATDLIVDQTGSFSADAGYLPLDRPVRLADTRVGLGVAPARLPAGSVLAVPVPDGADRATVLNVIAVDPSAPGFLTVFDCDDRVPETSNVNFVAEPVVSNLVITSLGSRSTVCIFSLTETDVVVDLAGSFRADPAGFDPHDGPVRLLDTREPDTVGRLGDRDTVAVHVGGSAAAAVLNVAVVDPAGPGFVTVYPCDIERPDTSNVNHVSIPVVSNVVIARPAADGTVCVYSSIAADIVVDAFGSLPLGSGFSPLAEPQRIVDTRDGTGLPGQLGTGS